MLARMENEYVKQQLEIAAWLREQSMHVSGSVGELLALAREYERRARQRDGEGIEPAVSTVQAFA